jgi:PTS system N-acetylglucosamine-specific IIC component
LFMTVQNRGEYNMKAYLQRIGRSLMLPVAVLPAAAILLGTGAMLENGGWFGEIFPTFLMAAGGSLIDNMGILFAIGVAFGMSKDKNGAAAIAGLVGWLVVTTMLSVDNVAVYQGIEAGAVDPAFANIETQFIGILVGGIAGALYNRFSETRLPRALAFFSGRRLVPIITALFSLVLSGVLYFAWPSIYGGLVAFGTFISDFGAIGAGLFGFFNRLLIPTGLHHALNSVFWFDVIGINDIGNFWAGDGIAGVTGMYQAGFFPVMMFGLPAAGLAMYKMADEDKKKQVGSLMFAAAFAAFLTGITEPLEFAFMFIAPALYVVHAALAGLSLFVAAQFGWILGFTFSAGLFDAIFSFTLPLANQPYMLILQGVIFFALYYFIFVWAIKTFDLKTPGRGVEVGDDTEAPAEAVQSTNEKQADNYHRQAKVILEGIGGPENISTLDHCTTRLRMELVDREKIDEAKIKSAGVPGINKTGRNGLQVIIGTDVQFVADEMKKMQ